MSALRREDRGSLESQDGGCSGARGSEAQDGTLWERGWR